MKPDKLVMGVVIILFIGAAAGVFASATVVNRAQSSGIQTLAQEPPGWQQVNSNGFGDQQTGEVSALEPFNGYLYAGTTNSTVGAQLFRSPDGVTWTPVTEPGFGISHDIAPPAILDLVVFNGQLYTSTGRGDGPAQIWRTADGRNWAPMVISGFSDPDTVDITALAVYNHAIYAGAKNLINGAQIWRSFTEDSNSWTQVAPGTPTTAPASVTGFATFNDALYAGAGNTMNGAQLWRTNDGEIWEQASEPSFGNPKNQKVELVFVFQNLLW